MSESGGARRASSDFSIEKILARDERKGRPRADERVELAGGEGVRWSGLRLELMDRYGDRRADRHETSEQRKQLEAGNSAKLCEASQHTSPGQFNGEELSWLRCTRYCPPKLPRKNCAGKNLKRRPGSHPRIPFTKYQLEELEDKYKKNAYLSRKDVVHLSELLQLPQIRIKIWFQNRRARERRESQLLDQTIITRT